MVYVSDIISGYLKGYRKMSRYEGSSYHFIVFRGQLEDTSQLGIHEIIGFRIFPLVGMKNGHVIHQPQLLAAGFYTHTCRHTHALTYFTHILTSVYGQDMNKTCCLQNSCNSV